MCFNSSLAVDGYIDPDIDSGHCSHTTNGADEKVAWWTVDFEGSYHLSSIQIYNRCKIFRVLHNYTNTNIFLFLSPQFLSVTSTVTKIKQTPRNFCDLVSLQNIRMFLCYKYFR